MFSKLKVLLVCEMSTNCDEIRSGLSRIGVRTLHKIDEDDNFLIALNEFDADLIILDVKKPTKALLSKLKVLNEYSPKPVVFFSESRDREIIAETVRAGVASYVVDGKYADRIEPLLEIAMIRFEESQAMKKELTQLKDKLSERGVVEKAKGLLIEHKNMTEDQAYKTMRKMAMDQGKKISVIAHEICSVLSGLDALV